MDITQLATSLLQQRRSTPGLIADAIRLAIVRGQLAPGQLLGQEELAKQFGLSRAPIRKVLRQLEGRTRRAHRFLSASRFYCGGADGRRCGRSFPDTRVCGEHCSASGGSQDERCRFSPSGCGAGADGFRPQFDAHGRIELGLPRKLVHAVRFASLAGHDQGTQHQHSLLSTYRIHRIAAEGAIATAAPGNSPRVSDSKRREGRRGTYSSFVRFIEVHCHVCEANREERASPGFPRVTISREISGCNSALTVPRALIRGMFLCGIASNSHPSSVRPFSRPEAVVEAGSTLRISAKYLRPIPKTE